MLVLARTGQPMEKVAEMLAPLDCCCQWRRNSSRLARTLL